MNSPMMRTADSGISIGPISLPTLSDCQLSHLQIEQEFLEAKSIINQFNQLFMNFETQTEFNSMNAKSIVSSDDITAEWRRLIPIPHPYPDSFEVQAKRLETIPESSKSLFEENSEFSIAVERDDDEISNIDGIAGAFQMEDGNANPAVECQPSTGFQADTQMDRKSCPLDNTTDIPNLSLIQQINKENPYINIDIIEYLSEICLGNADSKMSRVLLEYNSVCEQLQSAMKYVDYIHSETHFSRPSKAGQNDDGQLGRAGRLSAKFGKVKLDDKLDSIGRIQVREVVCGSMFAYALTDNNQLWCWGLADCIGREHGEIPAKLKDNVTVVTAGECISACIDTEGCVWSWGYFRNEVGKCRFDGATENQLEPKRVLVSDAIDIKAGESHLVCLTKEGSVYTWGFGEHGELGRPISLDRLATGQEFIPTKVLFHPVSHIFACGYNTFFVDENRVYACGKNSFGELGLGDFKKRNYPVLLDYFKNKQIVQIAGSIHHALFLDSEGKIYGAGRNNDGQLGVVGSKVYSTPQLIPTTVKIAQIAAGVSSASSYAIDTDGNLWTTGQSLYGQLGHWDPHGNLDDEPMTQLKFKKVSLKGDRRVQSVAGGCHFTLITAYLNKLQF
ncbi:Regulator of chromosome condensation [Terramyces sp. JEL0728]|nr:Regulator of chromosome condensation [Terramyces sp. JEL0728]